MIDLQNIHKTYQVGDNGLHVLKGISLNVDAGEYIALMGTSGSGKTTLMNLLGSLDYPTEGAYRFGGVDVSQLSPQELAAFRSQHIGFVFQNFNLLARTSALDNVLLPTLYATDGRSGKERVEYAHHLLETVGLGGRVGHSPGQLSGGERQRVAIARALINRPRLILADEPTGNLDSTTELEVLELFRQLNQEHNITLVVVTHDEQVARHTDRIIHMKDGVIVEDEPASVPGVAEQSADRTTERTDDRLSIGLSSAWPWAGALNSVSIAFRALRRNALRTALTMLGVIIGVASVVNVMELSKGASTAIEETVASMGASMLTVSTNSGSSTGRHQRVVHLRPDDVQAVADGCPSVQIAAPLIYARFQIVHGNRRWLPTRALCTSPDYLVARNWSEMQMGRSFSNQDVDDAASVCVIGQTVARKLFDADYPIGKEVRVNGVVLRVIGVLAEKGGDVIGQDQDDTVIVPWTTLRYRINESTGGPRNTRVFADKMPNMRLASLRKTSRNDVLHQVYVQAKSADLVSQARDEIRRVLARKHSVDAKIAYQINDMSEVSTATSQIVGALSALGLIIACVTLLVGGVGIMNIMLVSVTERTREIGLRMAVGAPPSAILRQFLVECTVLSLLGGLIGILVGHLGSSLVGAIFGWPTMLSILAACVALGVAATVGIVFGYYPARKASKLNPIDALRFE